MDPAPYGGVYFVPAVTLVTKWSPTAPFLAGLAWTGLGWPGLAWAGLGWPGLAKNAAKMTKNIKNEPKLVQVAPFGLILGENVATGSGKPLECLPGPKTPPGGPGGPKGAQGGPAPLNPLFPYRGP